MNEGDSEDKKLKWRFDISTFRLIGRELITDRIRMDDVYCKAREIDPIVEEYIKLVAVAKKYPAQAVRSADGILSLVERFGHDRMVLACQIAMESCMFGFNELESILVNKEDEKYHVQMEGQAPELTPKHRNLRGKDYFNSKNIDKNDK